MKDNTNNKEFWDDYVSYWENKVKEANDDENARDRTVDDVLLEKFFRRLGLDPGERLLDYGCGSCRLYPVYRQYAGGAESIKNYCGVDISKVSLEHARRRYPELKDGENLVESDGEKIPFADNAFDRIICFSVFDAVRQESVLAELLRVLKPGGRLLLTGKNKRYLEDDEEAHTAEVNARKKDHPNSFTDVEGLEKQLTGQGIEICEGYYFLRRCDFAADKYVCSLPDAFYQWALVLRKLEDGTFFFHNFSSHYSDTFIKREQALKKGE